MTSFCNQHLLNNVPPEHRVEAHRDLPGRLQLCLNLYNPLLHSVQVKAGLTQEPHVFDDSISLRIVLAERLTKPAVQIHLVNMWGRAEVVAIELIVTLEDHLPVRPSAPDQDYTLIQCVVFCFGFEISTIRRLCYLQIGSSMGP